MTISYAIEVNGLIKKYNDSLLALNKINLRIPYGSIFGLLGPNGAGKSSFINILAGLSTKTSGTVKVCGIDIDEKPKTVRGAIGVVPQEVNIDPFFTPIEILNNQAGYYGIKKGEMINDEILDQLNLSDKKTAYSRSLSGGMKRRLMLAKAMVHNPSVLVLDEPTAGVDVELRQKLWSFIKKLNNNGTTIILTTHYLEEAQELCDQIAIINEGRLVICDQKEELLKLIDVKEINVQLKENIKKIPKNLEKFLISHKKNSFILRFKKSTISTGEILSRIIKNRMNIQELTTRETDLEEIFLKLLKE